MSMREFHKQHPSQIEHLDEEECFYALIDETYSSHDGYNEREGGGFSTTHYIKLERLGNRQQVLTWLQAEEDAKQRQFYTPKKFKIVLMKPIQITRTVSFNV